MRRALSRSSKMDVLRLNEKNAHPRDVRVVRVRGKDDVCRYVIDGSRIIDGVTSQTKSDFDGAKWSAIKAGTGKYKGMSAAEVMKSWDEGGKWAARLGIAMHDRIQTYYDLGTRDWFSRHTLLEGESYHSLDDEYTKFLEWEDDVRRKREWEPYWMEKIVFDEVREPPLGGTIDAVFRSKEGFHVVDWKRNKNMDVSRVRKQLWLYADILQNRYDMGIISCVAVCIHPNHKHAQIEEFQF